jgi:hypothetical protein
MADICLPPCSKRLQLGGYHFPYIVSSDLGSLDTTLLRAGMLTKISDHQLTSMSHPMLLMFIVQTLNSWKRYGTRGRDSA